MTQERVKGVKNTCKGVTGVCRISPVGGGLKKVIGSIHWIFKYSMSSRGSKLETQEV